MANGLYAIASELQSFKSAGALPEPPAFAVESYDSYQARLAMPLCLRYITLSDGV
ncbi:MAG: hypothetical protein HY669_04335 [Chloroflexi bacterium]|nr:hypothetical protein [Chloroflexota bacterium]